jgi:hypothetical protein
MMTRVCRSLIVLAIALAPAVSDTCALGCDVGRPAPSSAASGDATCPLHHPHHAPAAPERCRHDHTVGRAGILRSIESAAPSDRTRSPERLALHSASPDLGAGSARAVCSFEQFPFTRSVSPSSTSRRDILRI